MVGFMSSEFFRIFKNSSHSDLNSPVVQKDIRLLKKNSDPKVFSRKHDCDEEGAEEFFSIVKGIVKDLQFERSASLPKIV